MANARKPISVHKKVRRKQALFFKHEPNSDVKFQEEPSHHVFVANGGLQNGLSRELLSHLLLGESVKEKVLKKLYLPAGKDYAFATFESLEAASTAVATLNGVCIQEKCRTCPASDSRLAQLLNPKLLTGPPLHLYLCFVDRIPQAYTVQASLIESGTESSSCGLPPGLILVKEFVSESEERELLEYFTATANTDSGGEHLNPEGTSFQTPENVLRHRYVKHYGYEFLYSSSNVDPDSPLPGGLPTICQPLLKRMREEKLVTEEPDQLTVNYYRPGAGNGRHSAPKLVFLYCSDGFCYERIGNVSCRNSTSC